MELVTAGLLIGLATMLGFLGTALRHRQKTRLLNAKSITSEPVNQRPPTHRRHQPLEPNEEALQDEQLTTIRLPQSGGGTA
jgi:hypothetical protein